jgi:hypothetical protein
MLLPRGARRENIRCQHKTWCYTRAGKRHGELVDLLTANRSTNLQPRFGAAFFVSNGKHPSAARCSLTGVKASLGLDQRV